AIKIIFRVRKIAAAVFVLPLDFDYGPGIFYRRRAQKQVEPRKERGVRANAHAQSDDGNQRKSWFLQKRSRSEAQVLPKVRHNIVSSSNADSHNCLFSYLPHCRATATVFSRMIKHYARLLSI